MGNEAVNNTNTILDTAPNPNIEPQAEVKPSITSLNDIQAIPEFQDNYKKNKIIALVSILIGIIILAGTAVYYYMGNTPNEAPIEESENNVNTQQVPAETPEQAEMTKETTAPGVLDMDPVISQINAGLKDTENENIEKTADDLEGFDFENIDLELKQNPGL